MSDNELLWYCPVQQVSVFQGISNMKHHSLQMHLHRYVDVLLLHVTTAHGNLSSCEQLSAHAVRWSGHAHSLPHADMHGA
jgi:hypothetical protein